MKKLLIGTLGVLLALVFAVQVNAAPNNAQKAEHNPNKVAYYETGIHAIPTDPITYVEGADLVTTRGSSGQIQAWYTGSDGHGFHSVWNESKDGKCPAGWIFIPDAYPTWGDYLTPGADYCVHVNAF